jgi:alcohol dehydrogenase, propanol-preferring
VNPGQLFFGAHALEGSLTGSPLDCEETLAFSLLQGIRPQIEAMPLEAADHAYAKMMRNQARFRMMLLTGR